MTMIRIPPTGLEDFNRDGKISPLERAGATALLGAGLCILLQLLYVLACLLFNVGLLPALRFWIRPWLPVTGILSVIATILLYSWRLLHYEKHEHQAARDLKHQRAIQANELARLQWELDQARGISDRQPATTYHQADIDAAAYRLLQFAYRGEPWTRDAWIARGEKAATWNEVNALLKSRNIRKGNQMIPETLADAWALYLEGKQKNQRRLWKDGLRDTK